MQRRLIFAVALCLWIPAIVVGADPKERAIAQLGEAKAAYGVSEEKSAKSLEEQFEKRLKTARASGKKELVDAIAAEQAAFQRDRTLPAWAAATILNEASRKKKTLFVAYEVAIRECVKSGDDSRATQLELERHTLRSESRFYCEADADFDQKILLGLWKARIASKDRVFLDAEWTFSADGSLRSRGNTGDVPGNWTLDRARRRIVITWGGKKEIAETLELPLHPDRARGTSRIGEDYLVTATKVR